MRLLTPQGRAQSGAEAIEILDRNPESRLAQLNAGKDVENNYNVSYKVAAIERFLGQLNFANYVDIGRDPASVDFLRDFSSLSIEEQTLVNRNTFAKAWGHRNEFALRLGECPDSSGYFYYFADQLVARLAAPEKFGAINPHLKEDFREQYLQIQRQTSSSIVSHFEIQLTQDKQASLMFTSFCNRKGRKDISVHLVIADQVGKLKSATEALKTQREKASMIKRANKTVHDLADNLLDENFLFAHQPQFTLPSTVDSLETAQLILRDLAVPHITVTLEPRTSNSIVEFPSHEILFALAPVEIPAEKTGENQPARWGFQLNIQRRYHSELKDRKAAELAGKAEEYLTEKINKSVRPDAAINLNAVVVEYKRWSTDERKYLGQFPRELAIPAIEAAWQRLIPTEVLNWKNVRTTQAVGVVEQPPEMQFSDYQNHRIWQLKLVTDQAGQPDYAISVCSLPVDKK